MNKIRSAREYAQDPHDLVNRIRLCKEEALLKYHGSYVLYHSDPERSNTLKREGLALENEARELERLQLAIKENPTVPPTFVEEVSLKVKFRNWLRSLW